MSAGSCIPLPTLDFELHENQDGILFPSILLAYGTWQVLNKWLSNWMDGYVNEV